MLISRRLAVALQWCFEPSPVHGRPCGAYARIRSCFARQRNQKLARWRGSKRCTVQNMCVRCRSIHVITSFTSDERTDQLNVACRIQEDLSPCFRSMFGHTKVVRWAKAPHDQSSAVRFVHCCNLNAYKSGLPHQAGLNVACIRDALLTQFKRWHSVLLTRGCHVCERFSADQRVANTRHVKACTRGWAMNFSTACDKKQRNGDRRH